MKTNQTERRITLKQANIFTILVTFFFSIIFVSLLVEQMYKDYELALEKNFVTNGKVMSQSEMLAEKQKKLKKLTIQTVLVIVTLSFLLFAIFLGLSNIFNRLLNKDTQTFIDFFDKAVHKHEEINQNMIFFEDFRVMVRYVNEMLEKINAQKSDLQKLNVELEDRVIEKTKALQLINENLVKEKRFSQELLKTQKEFLRYAVHETNTPLSVIITSIELYVMKNKKDRQLSKIEAAVKNISSIYDDLSYLVKKDQIEYPKMVLNLENYVSSRVDFFVDVAEMSRIKFQYLPEILEAHIYFNETKLQRIIDNTITNAIKYTLPNEDVTIRLKQNGTFVEFSMGSKSKIIKDVDRVFDAYYREDENREGFGLGLRLVRTICDEENVEILVSSTNDATVFTYRFKMMGE